MTFGKFNARDRQRSESINRLINLALLVLAILFASGVVLSSGGLL